MREAVKCPKCGNIIEEESIYCTHCGTHRPVYEPNYCTNEDCIRFRKKHLFDSKAYYCDLCGKPTTIGRKIEAHL